MTSETTLTREALFEKAARRYEVVDVDGWGKVGIRSRSQVGKSRRETAMFDDDGKLIRSVYDMRQIHMLIDQLMVDETTPMFTESDVEALGELDGVKLEPLHAAVWLFNATEDPKKTDASNDSQEN